MTKAFNSASVTQAGERLGGATSSEEPVALCRARAKAMNGSLIVLVDPATRSVVQRQAHRRV